jgi:hypothetical protein
MLAVLLAAGGSAAELAAVKPGVATPVRVSPDLLSDVGGSQAETQANPFLVADPEAPSHLVAVYEEALFADGGSRGVGVALSTNGGTRWQARVLGGLTAAAAGPFERAANPWAAFGPGHRLYVVAVAFDRSTPASGVMVASSADGGRTFGNPIPVHLADGESDERPAVVVDRRPDSPWQGRVYVSWDAVQGDGTNRVDLAWSDDGGASFTAPVRLAGGAPDDGVRPLIGPGGAVSLVWLHHGHTSQGDPAFGVALVRSTDGGMTWSNPQPTIEVRSAGVPGLHTADGRPTAGIDDSGTLFLAWQDDRFTPGVDQILVSRSADGGATWSPPVRVSDGPDDAPSFTPALAVDDAGRVGVSYTTLRNDADRANLADVYLAVSVDGGDSFAPSLRATPRSFDVRLAADLGGRFLGEVQGLVGAGGRFRPLFAATLGRSKKHPKSNQVDIWTLALLP